MATKIRRLGYNIEKAYKTVFTSIEDFAKAIDMSVNDVNRVIEGRLLLAPSKLKEIAICLGTSVNELFNANTNVSVVDCMGKFANTNNEDKILDLIDDYVYLLEVTSK